MSVVALVVRTDLRDSNPDEHTDHDYYASYLEFNRKMQQLHVSGRACNRPFTEAWEAAAGTVL